MKRAFAALLLGTSSLGVAADAARSRREFSCQSRTRGWYRLRAQIAGDALNVSLDGQLAGMHKSPGIAHPTKGEFHFTIRK